MNSTSIFSLIHSTFKKQKEHITIQPHLHIHTTIFTMSVPSSTASIKSLLQTFQKWTPDSLKRYASFKDFSVARYETLLAGPQATLNARNLAIRAEAAQQIQKNANKLTFSAEKLVRPASNPIYYERLCRELAPGQPKTPMLTAIRHVIFGGY